MTKKKRQTRSNNSKEPVELLRELIRDYFEALCEQTKDNAKLGDWLKMMEFYRKMAPEETAQKRLWKDLEKIRRKVLTENKHEKKEDSKSSKPAREKK